MSNNTCAVFDGVEEQGSRNTFSNKEACVNNEWTRFFWLNVICLNDDARFSEQWAWTRSLIATPGVQTQRTRYRRVEMRAFDLLFVQNVTLCKDATLEPGWNMYHDSWRIQRPVPFEAGSFFHLCQQKNYAIRTRKVSERPRPTF